MKKRIITSNESNEKIIFGIRSKFNLNDDLLLIAFTPKCIAPKNKYGICDHQSLEFYGDKIFYSLIMSLLYDFLD